MKRRRALGSVVAALLVFAVCLGMLPARVFAAGFGTGGGEADAVQTEDGHLVILKSARAPAGGYATCSWAPVSGIESEDSAGVRTWRADRTA